MRWIGLAALMAACSKDIEGDAAGECEDGADNDQDASFDCADPDCFPAPACTVNVEGDAAGGCADGADNDLDSQFDCDDADCAASPDCDDAPPIEPDSDEPAPPDETTDCVTSWDGQGDRPPGPHASEARLASAWQIDPTTYNAAYSAQCRDVGNPDWEGVFAPGDIELVPDPSVFYYVFYRVKEGCTEAQKIKCGTNFPEDCRNDDFSFTLSDGSYFGPEQEVEAALDPLLAPGCTMRVYQTSIVQDSGTSGVLTYQRRFTATPSCPASVLANNNCVMDFTYTLDWVRAE
jgi:hypothetical protein